MKRLDRILAVIDPTTDAQPALARAAMLARRCGAMLELFICDFDPSLSGQPFFDTDKLRQLRDEFLAERLEYLEETADELRAGGLAVETHVHWDNPLYRGVVRRVAESAPDLVVKDTHYHTALRRTLFTNTDWSLIRTCPAPILLAKGGDWPAVPRIVAALDPGHLGDKPAALDHDILDWGELFAARMGGELHAVHAFFPAALLAATTTMAGMPLVSGVTAAEIVATERGRRRPGARPPRAGLGGGRAAAGHREPGRVAAGDGCRVAQPAAGDLPRQHGRARARPDRLRRAGREAGRFRREAAVLRAGSGM